MTYTIEAHKHRFSAWAAGRAASVNGCRFKVKQGKEIIEAVKLNLVAKTIDNLPQPNDFDNQHRKWRNRIIDTASQKFQLPFTHGVAAKLINIYLKSIFVCSVDNEDPRIKVIHPPIDRVLLNNLYKNNFGMQDSEWKTAKMIGWSKLNSEQYESLISAIRQALPACSGLWQIEEYWQGFQ